MRRPNSTLEGLIFIVLPIPIGIYYLLKWLTKGIVILVYLCIGKHGNDVVCADLNEVDSLDGIAFEHFTAGLLRSNGYKQVTVTQASNDFGVDVVAYKDKKKWVFQCKCYQGKLGVSPIQEVFAGKSKYDSNVAVVVTNSYFTAHAIELANSLGVVLWDRNTISRLIKHTSSEKAVPKSEQAIPQSAQVTKLDKIPPVCTNRENAPQKTMMLGGDEMATIIGAGTYVFGEDIPMGKYNLKVIAGKGMLKVQNGDDENWINLGQIEGFAKNYSGLSLGKGQYFSLDGDVQVEITKSVMLEID